MYGAATDPYPYLVAAYVIGSLGIIGYSVCLSMWKKRLQRYLLALKKD